MQSGLQRKYLKDKKKCEEGSMKCKMENVLKGHIIHSNEINIWNVNSKYHTTTDHTKRHMKIYTIQKYISLFSACQENYLQEPREESC